MTKQDLKKLNAELLKYMRAINNGDLPVPFELSEIKELEMVQGKVVGLIEQFEIYEQDVLEDME